LEVFQVKALSVRAPWWWFILHSGKDIENRDWSTAFRGTVCLHAGKWWRDAEVKEDWDFARRVNPELGEWDWGIGWEMLGLGGYIVGTVDIVDCVQQSSSPWFQGKHGFVLANPVAFRWPVLCPGRLGLFEVPENVRSAIEAAR
jgi:hypothetical protein